MPGRQTKFRTLIVAAFATLCAVASAWSACPPGLPAEPIFHSPIEKLAPLAAQLADLVGSKAVLNRAIAGVETRQLSDVQLDPKLKYSFRIYTPLSGIPTHVQNAFIAAGEIPARADIEMVKHRQIGCIETEMLKAVYQGIRTKGREGEFVPRVVARAIRPFSQASLDPKEYNVLFAQKIKRSGNEAIVAYLTIKSDNVTFEKIAELSLNLFYFGVGSYGLTAASMNYFGKPVHQLSLAEAAYLAGVLRAPNNYHPIRKADKAKERRNEVLGRMVEMQLVSEAEAKNAQDEPFELTLK